MNRLLLLTLLLLTVSVFSSTTSTAQEFVPAPNQTYYLDLDTKDGAYSTWRLEDATSITRLRATIRVPRLGKDANWVPAFTFTLENREAGQETAKHTASVQLYAGDRKPPLVFRVIQRDGETSSTAGGFNKTVKLNEDVEIEMDWGSGNTLVIKVDGEVRKIPISWVVTRVVFSASTGELKCAPLVLGHTS